MIAFAPAKINLGLHILSKREDGFHNIETLMVPIPWYDVLELLPATGKTKIIMHCSVEKIETERNLVFKAWQLLNKHHNIAPVCFHLLKAIPSGAGLGGGSSDAVTALKMLNRFFNLNLPNNQLHRYASELGSDCPFFVETRPSIARGKGEILTPFDIDLSRLTLLVAKHRNLSDGRQGISTAQAYSSIVPNKNRKNISELASLPIEKWVSHLQNDFQPVIEKQFPEIRTLITSFYNAGAKYAAMSGSGSACFGIFDKKNPDLQLSSRDFQVFSSVL
ncbi:MAG: 4-(cytidine 5'-diphospho)-2-C-methyl-D-erythritol kinase [Bacteroidetes bacterium HGW-Bacteroidetes-6]|jgi:4-diphosphocytidyl-2-C-methyl-D-erythritol kinase|nr:MAG: 4-(cytidine 5'-diphospho)-2-C-methyl-D-erythritol kinase [Bacteroidetes bacterium HGW-Bacteroidetes-6]